MRPENFICAHLMVASIGSKRPVNLQIKGFLMYASGVSWAAGLNILFSLREDVISLVIQTFPVVSSDHFLYRVQQLLGALTFQQEFISGLCIKSILIALKCRVDYNFCFR